MTSGQKLRSGPPSPGKKQAVWHGHPVRMSMKKNFGLKNFGLIFCSLIALLCRFYFYGRADFSDNWTYTLTQILYQKTFRYLLRFYSLLFHGFFVALFCLKKQCSGLFRYFFVGFSWLFRGPCFGQILRVLALEQSSDFRRCA